MMAKTLHRRRALLGVALLLLCLFLSSSVAKEVELTNEWQLLGENDTVPAGAHIRMDLSGGGRWAKLNTDKDEENAVEIDSSGGIMSVKEQEENTAGGGVVAKTADGGEKQQFEFHMMHRALSHLPQEEKERMGGLPEIPEEGADSIVRMAFEERMKEIWTLRQAELQLIQEESMADLPKLLLERVKRLDSYLQDPYSELSQEWKDNDGEGVTHVLSVLKDLEGHFSDIDMTRDFHFLGGWPLLVSLLSDNVHLSPNATLTQEQLEKVHDIQANAAWAIGTAVKNIGEFAPWATEKVSIDGVETTPLELLLDQLKKNDDMAKTQKVLYALGSMLRGNRMAQAHFCAAGGPLVLGKMLSNASRDAALADAKMTKRILALADDVVSDAVLHPYEQDDTIDKLVISSFTKKDWCQSPIPLLERDELQETALETIQTLEPYCKWNKKKLRKSLTKVKEKRQEEENEHIVALVDAVLSEL